MFVVCFMFARPIYNILAWPLHLVAPDVRMIATHLLEELFTNIKLAMFGAAFLSFPFAAYQLYKFVAPGLYKNEKDAFRPYLLWTWLLFIARRVVVYFLVMPLLIKFSIGSVDPAKFGGDKPPFDLMPKIAEYLSLIMQLIIGFGVIFQLPVDPRAAGPGGHRDGAEPAGFLALCHRRHRRRLGRAVAARSVLHAGHDGADRRPLLRRHLGRASASRSRRTTPKSSTRRERSLPLLAGSMQSRASFRRRSARARPCRGSGRSPCRRSSSSRR